MEHPNLDPDLFASVLQPLREACDAEKARVVELVSADRLAEAEGLLRALVTLREILSRAEAVAADYQAWYRGSWPASIKDAVAEASSVAGIATEAAPEPQPAPQIPAPQVPTEEIAPPAPSEQTTLEPPAAEETTVAPEAPSVQEEAPKTTAAVAEPVEAVFPPPKPERKTLTPAERNKRSQLEREFREVCQALSELNGKDEWTLEDRARAKANLCLLRALELELRPLGFDTAAIREESRYFGGVIGRQSGNGSSNLATEVASGKPEDWRDYARAFQCLAEGEKAAAWIREHPGNRDYRKVLNDLAACGHIVYRLHLERRLPFDKQQEAFKKFVEEIAGDAQIQCWMAPDNGGPKTDRVFKLAEGFAQKFQGEVVARLKAAEREFLLAHLIDFVSAPYEGDDFLDVLEKKIEACLKAGTQPSNKKLRECLVPFAAILRPGTGQYGKLIEYVRGDALNDARNDPGALAGKDTEVEAVSDEEHQRRVEDLQRLLRGKRMLIVGGAKGQAQRKHAIEKMLELADVEWPDVEKDDTLDVFWPRLEKADIAVQLIKFCRHHYAEVLREGKEKGKMVARIKGGLGLKRIALDLHEQLIANQSGNGK